MRSYKLELCTESVEDAIRLSNKVDQIEFCSDLQNDGLTPDYNDVKLLLSKLSIPLKVMVRNREGNFIYSEDDFLEMCSTALKFKDLGVDRFVFGALHNNRLDIDQIKRFSKVVYPGLVCVHKAIDLSEDILEDVKLLLDIENVNEILSSGSKNTAMEGLAILKQMILIAKDKIDIICAGKITVYNLKTVALETKAKIFHGKKIVE